MSRAELVASAMSAAPGGIGAFSVMRGCWDVNGHAVAVGVVMLILAVAVYSLIVHLTGDKLDD